MITVYSRDDCPRCKVLKMKLEQKNIEYTECKDEDLMIEKGFTELPTLDIDGKIIGFTDGVEWVNNWGND